MSCALFPDALCLDVFFYADNILFSVIGGLGITLTARIIMAVLRSSFL